MRKTLIIDNYDSFTYNLYQFLGELKANPIVFRNNEITLEEIKNLEPTHIVISPGPGTVEKPEDFGICMELIQHVSEKNTPLYGIPLLGVCLGHQGIIQRFGGTIEPAPTVIHGKRSVITHNNNSTIFKEVPKEFEGMRYHSLIGKNPDKKLTITATLKENPEIIMAVEHKTLPIYGIQFHPESIGTPEGKQILTNFLEIKPFSP